MSEFRFAEPAIMPVTPGTISQKDRNTLAAIGVIVIECANPQELRLIRPTIDIGAGEMLKCAMNALTSQNEHPAVLQRSRFAHLLAEAVSNHNEPKGK
jgi:hypothetical protein